MEIDTRTQQSNTESPAIAANMADFVPVRLVTIELGQALPDLSTIDEQTGQHYQRALCLICLHSYPMGMIELQLDKGEGRASSYVQRIWDALEAEINEHWRQDGLPELTGLRETGLSSSCTPCCVKEREQFFAGAPFVSVIVSTHNRPEHIVTCLRSLLDLHYPQYEIIIVDNAPSSNATAEFIQQFRQEMPQVRYLREERPGLSRARNCGMLAARGEILAFTDDDVVVDPYWLIELVRAFRVADNVVCTTGLVLPLELETPAQAWLEEFGGFSKGFSKHIFDLKEHRPRMPLYPYAAGRLGTGASMAFKASFLHSVGGFDPALGSGSPAQGGEDLAVFFQVLVRGYKLVYQPAALLRHLHRRDYPGLRKQIYNYGIGLIAYLLKSLVDQPHLLFDFVAKLPYGIFFALSRRSPKNRKKSTHYPGELTTLELQGICYGPLAYLRGRWETRNAHKALPPVEMRTTLPATKEI